MFGFQIAPMLKRLFSQRNDQGCELSYGKLIEVKQSGNTSTKITLKSGNTRAYEILKEHAHTNIVPVVKLTQHSVYTKKVVSFQQNYDKEKKEYSEYVLKKLGDALDFIHTVLKKEHRAVTIESILLEESGKPLLSNFEKIRDFESSRIDDEMLEDLRKMLTCKGSEIKREHGEFFDNFFKLTPETLQTSKTEDKISLLNQILQNKDILPKISIRYIFRILILDAEKDQYKEYKTAAMDFLYALDKGYFYENKKTLFAILDSTIRVYLLGKFISVDIQNVDEIASDLSLGLHVKDKSIKKHTLEFIFRHKFGSDAMLFLLDSMTACTDSESIGLICDSLLNLENINLNKPVYKLLYQFLQQGKCTIQVYKCIDKYYTLFDKIKVTKEILPTLCSKLVEKENQEYCFSLVEKILKFLKNNKDSVAGNEWSFKSIKNILNKKPEAQTKFEERVSKFSKEDAYEWNENEIE